MNIDISGFHNTSKNDNNYHMHHKNLFSCSLPNYLENNFLFVDVNYFCLYDLRNISLAVLLATWKMILFILILV